MQESLEYFGLTAESTQRDLKRAYAKKLKVTSPEKDPEGFQVLRARYEEAIAFLKQIIEQTESVQADSQHSDADSAAVESEAPEPESNGSAERYEFLQKQHEANEALKGIIRSLSNGMEDQAIAYLNMLDEDGYFLNVDFSIASEGEILRYLSMLQEMIPWPGRFFTHFRTLLHLDENRILNRENRAAFHRCMEREEHEKHAEYLRQEAVRLLNKIEEACNKGTEDIIARLLQESGLFRSNAEMSGGRQYFSEEYLRRFPELFPNVISPDLRLKIEQYVFLGAAAESRDESIRQAYQTYMELIEKWTFFSEKLEQAREHKYASISVAWQMLLDDDFPVFLSHKASSVYRSLQHLKRLYKPDQHPFFQGHRARERLQRIHRWEQAYQRNDISVYRHEAIKQPTHTGMFGAWGDVTRKAFKSIFSSSLWWAYYLCFAVILYMVMMSYGSLSEAVSGLNVKEISVIAGFATGPVLLYLVPYVFIQYLLPYHNRIISHLDKSSTGRRFQLVTVIVIAAYSFLAVIRPEFFSGYAAAIACVTVFLISGPYFFFRQLLTVLVPVMIALMMSSSKELKEYVLVTLVTAVWLTHYLYMGVRWFQRKSDPLGIYDGGKQRILVVIAVVVIMVLSGVAVIKAS